MRAAPLDRLPGNAGHDPFLRLAAAAWPIGHSTNTATAFRRDLHAWATWCQHLAIHPLPAEGPHVDAWIHHLASEPTRATGRPMSAASIAHRLSAQVLTHSPMASVRGPTSATNPPPSV